MATEVIKIVDPDNGSGTNYTSLSAWEAGEQGDLTGARDEIAVAKCRCTGGTADTKNVQIDGWTTDSTRYIKIWTDPSESYRHSGKWTTGNKYRLQVASFHPIDVSENYVKIIGLQIALNTTTTHRGVYHNISENATIEISHCIIRSMQPASAQYGIYTGVPTTGTQVFKVWNCILYDWYRGINSRGNGATVTVYAYNVTLHGCSTGLYTFNGEIVAKNCLISATDAVNAAAGSITTTYCACTESGGLSGTGCRSGQTFTFVDEANDDFHLSSSDAGAKDYGTDLSGDSTIAFSDDIDGETRSGTWDIGADEYVAAGSAAYPYYVKRRLNVLLRLCLSTFTSLIGRLAYALR